MCLREGGGGCGKKKGNYKKNFANIPLSDKLDGPLLSYSYKRWYAETFTQGCQGDIIRHLLFTIQGSRLQYE